MGISLHFRNPNDYLPSAIRVFKLQATLIIFLHTCHGNFATENGVNEMIKRTLGPNSKYFNVVIDTTLEKNCYYLYTIADSTNTNVTVIHSSDGISAARGFHYYLKNYLLIELYWYNRYIQLPDDFKWPAIKNTISSKSASDIVYYQNVCAWGYSYVWWNYDQWVRHIDWMAMMGVRLTIAPIQEQLWYETFQEMGLSESDIAEYFTGPAFLPWLRMGNIHTWFGPISEERRKSQFNLQQKIIHLQRSLGMKVAVPAFSGFLPLATKRLYPNVTFSVTQRWNRFPNIYCCSLFLTPDQPLFTEISIRFQRRVIHFYGTDHIYFADPYNELQPDNLTVEYIKAVASGIYKSMQFVDKEAIWLLQGWMFTNTIVWSDDLVRAFLTSVPSGKMLILDLQSEQRPQYERTFSYYGQPFIWCMLHNFGGTLGMHGSIQAINEGISKARNMANSSMVGVGITPEGINQNYVMYSLVLDYAWSNLELNLTKWFANYATLRYGVKNENLQNAWHLLQDSVYSYRGSRSIHGKYVLVRRPSFYLQTWTWYNPLYVYDAWRNLLIARKSIPYSHYDQYEYDLVDITRQYLQIKSELLYIDIINAYKRKQINLYNKLAHLMMKLFVDLEAILSTHVDFLLGVWLEAARSSVPGTIQDANQEKPLNASHARNQITIWGPNGEILDYATKQWSGLVKDYHAPRWEMFLNELRSCLLNNNTFNNTAFAENVFISIEKPFSYQKKSYPSRPKYKGMSYPMSKIIFKNWS